VLRLAPDCFLLCEDNGSLLRWFNVATGQYYVLSCNSYLHCTFPLYRSYVGIYGDADPLDIAQWSQMTYTVPSDTRRWTEATSTCTNMFNGQ